MHTTIIAPRVAPPDAARRRSDVERSRSEAERSGLADAFASKTDASASPPASPFPALIHLDQKAIHLDRANLATDLERTVASSNFARLGANCAGADPALRFERRPWPASRADLEALIEAAIAYLDELDGNPDLEETGDLEPWLAGSYVDQGQDLEHDDADAGIADFDGLIEQGHGAGLGLLLLDQERHEIDATADRLSAIVTRRQAAEVRL